MRHEVDGLQVTSARYASTYDYEDILDELNTKDSITYIHNWRLQPFSQDCGLASHITYVVCVNFYTLVAGPIV